MYYFRILNYKDCSKIQLLFLASILFLDLKNQFKIKFVFKSKNNNYIYVRHKSQKPPH